MSGSPEYSTVSPTHDTHRQTGIQIHISVSSLNWLIFDCVCVRVCDWLAQNLAHEREHMHVELICDNTFTHTIHLESYDCVCVDIWLSLTLSTPFSTHTHKHTHTDDWVMWSVSGLSLQSIWRLGTKVTSWQIQSYTTSLSHTQCDCVYKNIKKERNVSNMSTMTFFGGQPEFLRNWCQQSKAANELQFILWRQHTNQCNRFSPFSSTHTTLFMTRYLCDASVLSPSRM